MNSEKLVQTKFLYRSEGLHFPMKTLIYGHFLVGQLPTGQMLTGHLLVLHVFVINNSVGEG